MISGVGVWRVVVIGIVGRSGVGKTTVSKMFESLGAVTLDVDQVGRAVLSVGSDTLGHVFAEFGSDYMLPDGSLDRRRLGAVVFSDPAQLHRLNSITHPVIVEQVRAWLDRVAAERPQPAAAVIDAAVLFEAGLDRLVDYVVLVVAGDDVSVARLVERDQITPEAAAARLHSQVDPEAIAHRADFVVHTEHSLDQTMAQVRVVWDQMMNGHGVK
jgi:dephospho-CoA kinase